MRQDLAAMQERRLSWAPFLFELAQRKKQRDQEWQMIGKQVDYLSALKLDEKRQEKAHGYREKENLQEQGFTIANIEAQGKQARETKAAPGPVTVPAPYPPQAKALWSQMYKDVPPPETEEAANAMIPLMRALGAAQDEEAKTAAFEEAKPYYAMLYKEREKEILAAPGPAELAKVVGLAESERKGEISGQTAAEKQWNADLKLALDALNVRIPREKPITAEAVTGEMDRLRAERAKAVGKPTAVTATRPATVEEMRAAYERHRNDPNPREAARADLAAKGLSVQ
jgi:hypothetical protein